MMNHNFSQLPVTSDGRIVGSIFENKVMGLLLESPDKKDTRVEEIMSAALPFVDISTPIDTLAKMVSGEYEAILVKDFKRDKTYIITRSDLAEVTLR
jgi:cystathionine beta-synthase